MKRLSCTKAKMRIYRPNRAGLSIWSARVRRAGVREDPHSGQSYEHRRSWIRSPPEFWPRYFAIDCRTYYCAQQLTALVWNT